MFSISFKENRDAKNKITYLLWSSKCIVFARAIITSTAPVAIGSVETVLNQSLRVFALGYFLNRTIRNVRCVIFKGHHQLLTCIRLVHADNTTFFSWSLECSTQHFTVSKGVDWYWRALPASEQNLILWSQYWRHEWNSTLLVMLRIWYKYVQVTDNETNSSIRTSQRQYLQLRVRGCLCTW